jgi:uncharacterized protein YndB with AHSA1/START domain
MGGTHVTINASAPAVARKEIRIKARPEEVWAIHTDISGWWKWNADVTESKLHGALGEGTTFDWKTRGTGISSRIELLEPGRRIGWTGRSFGTRAVHLWTLIPDGEGTLLQTEESMEGWLVNLLRGPIRRKLEQSLNAWLVDLKHEVEMGNGYH